MNALSKVLFQWKLRIHGLIGYLRPGSVSLFHASRPMTVGVIVLSGISGLMPLAELWALKGLVDAVTHRFTIATGTADSHFFNLVMITCLPWLCLLVGAIMLSSVINSCLPLLIALLNERMLEVYSREIYMKAMSLDLDALEEPEYYDKLLRANNSLRYGMVQSLYAVCLLMTGLVASLGILVMIAQLYWGLALILVLGSIPVVISSVKQEAVFDNLNYESSPLKRRIEYFRDLMTKREPAAEVRLFNLGPMLLQKWHELYSGYLLNFFVARSSLARMLLGTSVASRLLDGVVLLGILSIGLRSHATAGLVVASIYGIQQIEQLRLQIESQLQSLSDFYFNSRHYAEFIAFDRTASQSGQIKPIAPPTTIKFIDVEFMYPGSAKTGLGPINLTIQAGERLALVGENGAGKTTLVKLLLGLYKPTAGQIQVDGINLNEISADWWRQQATAIFQDFAKFNLTASENIGFGDIGRLDDDASIHKAAVRSGADDFIIHLPHQYNTLLGRGFTGSCDLSLGQWQKIALARAYLREVSIVILDEPASGLDAIAERDVYTEFSRVATGRAMVLISHRLGSARLADKILFLKKGRIVETGSHENLVLKGGAYAALYELQAEWYRTVPFNESVIQNHSVGSQ